MKNLFIKCFYLFIFLVTLLFYPSVKISYAFTSPPSDSERLIIKFKASALSHLREQIISHINEEVQSEIKKLDIHVVNLRKDIINKVMKDLQANSFIDYVEKDYLAQAFDLPSDPKLQDNTQWALNRIEAAQAWTYAKSQPSVKIAILDTGIDMNHEDVKDKIVLSNNCTSSPTLDDIYGHGTHVAGIAAAATNNGIGVAGVGYDASLMNGKVLGDNGYGYYSWIAQCITWAADNGAHIINLSLGSPQRSSLLEDAINYAWNKGVVIVAAAGNSGNTTPMYPADFPNVLSVAATDHNDQKTSYSTFGSWVKVAAPGDSIYSTYKNNQYALMSGTSMSSAHVAGLAGLVTGMNYCSSNQCIVDRIQTTSDTISGTQQYWKYGRINALKAVTNSQPTGVLTSTPTLTPTLQLTPTFTPTFTPTPALSAINQLTMTVESIQMWAVKKGLKRDIYSKVKILDLSTQASLSQTNVFITLTTPSGNLYSGSSVTDGKGVATFVLRRSTERGVYKTNIDTVAKTSYIYQPSKTSSELKVE